VTERKRKGAGGKSKGPGRPRKIEQVVDEQGTMVWERIVADMRVGAYFEQACARAGISAATGYRYLEQGNEWVEDKDGVPISLEDVPDEVRVFREFRDAVEKSKAEARLSSLAVIRQAAQGTPPTVATDAKGEVVRDADGNPVLLPGLKPQWRAAAWYLERTDTEHFGRVYHHLLEGTGEDGALTLLHLDKAADEAEEQEGAQNQNGKP
jgi:hypothetical protein